MLVELVLIAELEERCIMVKQIVVGEPLEWSKVVR